jgi:hypothetical protein
MKRLLILTVLFSAALILVNCDLFGTTEDYYPMATGTTWDYKGSVTMTATDADPDTISTSAGRAEVTGTAELASGEEVARFVNVDTIHSRMPETTYVIVDTNYVRQDGDYVLAYSSLDDTEADTALALPLELNKTWQVWASGDTSVTGTVVAQEDVTVPAGTYTNCWKVEMETTIGTDVSAKMHYWYADGIGRVKWLMENIGGGYKMTARNDLTAADIK